MRYREFKLTEAPDDGTRAGQEPNAPVDDGLTAGPPYPSEQLDAVKALQARLEELGYSVGSTGIDGKYGPRTQRAVAAFKRDNNISTNSTAMARQEIAVLDTAKRVNTPSPTGNGRVFQAADLEELNFGGAANEEAKRVAEEFLGRELGDQEWNYLVRATAAEASPNDREQAAVMAVILNRVRTNFGNNGTTVQRQLGAQNQFQAVTGTSVDRSPSRNFTNPTPRQVASVVQSAIDNLPTANNSWLNFTANNPRAYGPGTDISFLTTMRNSPGATVIGGTIFGTARG
jgi:peptidoglycan hydrolase-like protein with peptidoglycan-binding domain